MEIKKKTDFLRFFNKNKNRIFAVLAIVTAGTIISQVLAATNITSVVPDNGTSLGGTEIIINGSGFTDYTPAVGTNFTFQSPNGACQQYTIPSDGYYQLETWGAQGGTGGANVGGRGGYSVGTVFMRAGTSTFVCVGGQGTASPRTSTSAYGGGFNGGGASYRNDMGNGRETATGGGGTDIRIGANSLYARAIVAGGGGGASGIQWSNGPGGAGGGLNGTAGNAGVMPGGNGTGASQTAGGTNNASGCTGVGAFGSATNCPFTTAVVASGGGGGWFGGGSGLSAGGGSGFVFTTSSNVSNSVIGGTYLLNNDYQMFDTRTVSGSTTNAMPAPGGGVQTGQPGNGYARMTRLPYYVLIGGNPCKEVEILSDTQIRCITPAHSAAIVDVQVTIDTSTFVLTNGYTYTDKLAIAGPVALTGNTSATYTVSLDYFYTGIVMLSDGGVGGTFSGPSVVSGNRLYFNNNSSLNFTYTPPAGYQGDITLVADSGVTYVTNGQLKINVSIMATAFSMECLSGGTTGTWINNPFIVPGTNLNCRIMLNGSYNGSINILDTTGETPSSLLGGTFTSSDPRFSGNTFTTTIANTLTNADQLLYFTYTSPDWNYIMDNLYDGGNGYYVFWPVLVATSSPALSPAQSSVSVGLLAQAYEIVSINTPKIGVDYGVPGCLGCTASFLLSTFSAPYFGQIEISSEVIEGGTAQSGGTLFAGAGQQDTITLEFNGSGSSMLFRYTPEIVGDDGIHTLVGASSGPAIADTDYQLEIIDSHIKLFDCVPSYLLRGQTAQCRMIFNGEAGGADISIYDMFIAPGMVEDAGWGIFTDTSASPNPTGTFDDSTYTYTFCNGVGSVADDCPSETWERTFTYSLPLDTPDIDVAVRIMARNDEPSPPDVNWTIIDIIPDNMFIECSDISPNCEVGHVGRLQDYIIRPNGVFTGKVKISDGDPNSTFSDNDGIDESVGYATWGYSGEPFDFEYTPGSTGIKTLTAEVVEVADPNSGIKVGDKYYFTVIVMADNLQINGPNMVARDETPPAPRFSLTLNGPYIGTISGRMVRYEGATEVPFTNSFLAGFNIEGGSLVTTIPPSGLEIWAGDGSFSCTITEDMIFNADGSLTNARLFPGGPLIYDPNTNITTACIADSGGAEGFLFDYNWFNIEAGVPTDPFLNDVVKPVGLVADGYTVTNGGMDATYPTRTIVTTFGTPLDFVLTPNALFAGEYTFVDDVGTGVFVPGSKNIIRTQSQWPPFNDQTMQSQTFTYVPQQTGIIYLTTDAIRETGIAPAGREDLGEKTIKLIVLANNMTITGPDSVVVGSDTTYTITLNGPYVGPIEVDESTSDGILSTHVDPTECMFSLDNYDPVTNTTSCDFTLTASFEEYWNTVMIFASSPDTPLSASKTINVIANAFTVVPEPLVENTKINNPVEYMITPNAQFEGTFTVSIVQPPIDTDYGTCPNPADFSATINPDTITYLYSDYASVGQNPVSKTFVFTPHNFGHVCFMVTSSDPSMEPHMIEMHIFGDMTLGGPNTIVKGQESGEYTLTVQGEVDGTIEFSLYDTFASANISGTIVSSQGGASCTFDHTIYDPVTNTTTCTLRFTLPASFTGNYLRLYAKDIDTGHGLDDAYIDISVVANAYDVMHSGSDATAGVIYADIDTPITFSIEPNALYVGAFALSDDDGGLFSPQNITFARSDWPADQTPMSGKTFTYAPAHYGYNIVTVTNELGTKTITVLVLADAMDLSGPASIQVGPTMSGNYVLAIHGPYEGAINFAVTNTATGATIPGVTLSNGGSCTVTTADYDVANDETLCNFTVSLPANYSTANRITVTATTATGDRYMAPASAITMITANDYLFEPGTTQVVSVGSTLTFAITPNAIFSGYFNISSTGSPNLSNTSLSFSVLDYPATNNNKAVKTFTVTPNAPGKITVTVSSALGDKSVDIYVLAGINQSIDITGPSAVQKGTTSGDYTLTIPGPYVGTITLSVGLQGGGVASGVTLSTNSCVFTLAEYNEVTNTTSCTFTMSVPSPYNANYLNINAYGVNIADGNKVVELLANTFTLTPSPEVAGEVGTPITFTVTPNGLFAGTLNLTDNGKGGTFSPTSVTFARSDWPADQTAISGKTFTYTPTRTGYITITARDASTASGNLGYQETLIIVYANSGSISGPDEVLPGDTGSYTLTINGPYEGTIDLSLWRPDSGGDSDLTDGSTFSPDSSCTFTLADYDPVTNTTTCTFEVKIPDSLPSTNYLEIRVASDPELNIPNKRLKIMATDFTVAPTEVFKAKIGKELTFRITPNALFAGTFTIADGTGKHGTVVFTSADWPAFPGQGSYYRTFTFTPLKAGKIVLNVCNVDLGCKQVIIHAIADGGEIITPPDTGIFSGLGAVGMANVMALAVTGVLALIGLLIVKRRQE